MSAIRLRVCDNELSTASRVYRRQLDPGSQPKTALVLATIAYLQRNPTVPTVIGRARVAASVGTATA